MIREIIAGESTTREIFDWSDIFQICWIFTLAWHPNCVQLDLNKYKISIKNHQNSLQFDAHSSQCDQHASSSRLACFLASALSHCSNVEPIQRFCWASRKCKAHYDDSCSCFPEHMEPMIWCQHRRPVLVVALVHNRSYKCFDRGQKSSQVSYKL